MSTCRGFDVVIRAVGVEPDQNHDGGLNISFTLPFNTHVPNNTWLSVSPRLMDRRTRFRDFIQSMELVKTIDFVLV